jgi:hypothetical protein
MSLRTKVIDASGRVLYLGNSVPLSHGARGRQLFSVTDLRATIERALGDTLTFEREIVGGSMSRVFVAMDRNLGREIIVNVLSLEVAADLSVDRFRREIQLAARLQHPHIIPLHSASEIDGAPYFSMPFVGGESLRAKLSHAKFSRVFHSKSLYGQSIRAFQILEQVEKVEQVNEEVSKKVSERVEQIDQTGEPARAPFP